MRFAHSGPQFRDWLQYFLPARRRAEAIPCRRLRLEQLEDRLAPAAHDTLATALPLLFDASRQALVSGTLAGNQIDLYAVSLNSGDEVFAAASAQVPGSTLDSYLRVFDSNGQPFAFDDDSGSNRNALLAFRADTAGTYYVGVSSYHNISYDPNQSGSGSDGRTDGGYTLSLQLQPEPDIGDTLKTARLLSFGADQQVQVSSVISAVDAGNQSDSAFNDVDLFAVQLNAGDEVTAQTTADSMDTFLRVFDANGRQLNFNDDRVGTDAGQTFDAATTGTYYIGISSYRNSNYDPTVVNSGTGGTTSGTYTLDLKRLPARVAESEADAGVTGKNDSLQTADVIGGTTRLRGAIGKNDSDYFRFTATDPGQLTATVSAMDGKALLPRLALYNDSGALLILADAPGPGQPVAQWQQHLLPGTYYLKVSASPGTSSTTGQRSYLLDTAYHDALPPLAALPMGTNAYYVATADCNHDGIPDLLVANNGASSVSVLLGNGDGSFQENQSLAVGTNPVTVAVGDFNGDNNLDLAVANYNSATISMLLGRGDGTFVPARTVAVGHQPSDLAIGDFNHDGNLDLAIPNLGDNTVSVLLGQGDGTFHYGPLLQAGKSPSAVAVKDFDHDGNLDLAVANRDDGTVTVFLGQGHGAFRLAQTVPVGSSPVTVAVGDFNHDGKTDLVVPNHGDTTVSLLLGQGDGSFVPDRTLSLGKQPLSVAVDDFNGDGKSDLAVTSEGDNTISVLLGQDDGSFQLVQTISAGSKPQFVAVADVNQDGYPDLAVTGYDSDSLAVLLGRGDGTFLAPDALTAGRNPIGVARGDFNHDGNLDLAIANNLDNSVSVLLGRGDGSFQPGQILAVGLNPVGITAGDFNGDGSMDLAVTNFGETTVSLLLGRGDGTFLPARPLAVGKQPADLVVGDFNGDALPDLAVANLGDNTVAVLLGLGDGNFLPPRPFAVGRSPAGLTVADFNHDHILDLAVANRDDKTVSILLGRSDGSFGLAQPFPAGSGALSVAAADFNHDGQTDLAIANRDDKTVSVLLGQGDGTFKPAPALTVGKQPISVTVGDFNNDGVPDLAVAVSGDKTVAVLLGQGDGSFTPTQTLTAGVGPRFVAVGDFNKDNKLDIVTSNYGDNTVSMFLGRADSSFRPFGLLSAGKGPRAETTGDFNHDGIPDLAVVNGTDNTVSILQGTGTGTFQLVQTIQVGANPYALAVIDFNHDGNPDLAVVNSDEGKVSILMGSESGLFQLATTITVGNTPQAVAVGDFDHNGLLDLAVANLDDSSISILLCRSDGSFLVGLLPDLDIAADSLLAGDFNHDGNVDLAAASYRDSKVLVLLGNGHGSFSPGQELMVGGGPYWLGTGDFNNDGILDLATPNSNDNTVSILLGNGDGSFRPVKSVAVGDTPESLVVGDFNRDGNQDLAVADYGPNTVSVLLGRGDGSFRLTQTISVGTSPDAIVAADFNGDGLLDLATANFDAGTVSVLLGGGGVQLQPATPEDGISVHHTPLLKDLNHDGIPDTVILNSGGEILFRGGLVGDPNHFAPPLILNPDHPARDITLLQTAAGPALAAVDTAGNSVSLYSWSSDKASFQRRVAFSTGALPVRIAAARLNGDALDDLVVANDFDHSITIAFQTPAGSFAALLTRPVGVGPSGLAFANLDGRNGTDIVISDQISGDFTVLFNDPNHLFTLQARYRAGTGLFGLAADTGETTVQSSLQTIGIVAGDFSRAGSQDLVVVNRGARSLTLLANQGQGHFTEPRPDRTYRTSARPGQVSRLTLPGDSRPSVAVLMEDLHQVWIYPNNGKGGFAAPWIIDAGNDATGFSVGLMRGQLALLVGNSYGDILTLLYNGRRGFAPDRSHLHNAPLFVGTLSGQQYAVVANQKLDQVSLYYRVPGARQFGSPVLIHGTSQLPLLAPGAVQTFYVPGDPSPYLAVANSLSNDVLLYHYDPSTGQFSLATRSYVGNNPVSITVGDINGDQVPDLAVANKGSNDVSILIGTMDTGSWTATSYQRLKSGGSGPVGVSFLQQPGSSHGPDLVATNSDGTLTLIPGIGTGGTGSGFFAGPDVSFLHVPGQPLGPLSNGLLPTTQGIFQINPVILTVTQVFASTALTAISVGANGQVAAGFRDGKLELLEPTSTGLLAETLIFRDAELTDPSALQLDQSEIYATNSGEDRVFVFALSEGIAVPGFNSPFEPRGQAAEVQPLSEAGLFLIATYVTSSRTAAQVLEAGLMAGGIDGGLGALSLQNRAALLSVLLVGGSEDLDQNVGEPDAGGMAPGSSPTGPITPPSPASESASPLNDYIIGVSEALRTIRSQIRGQRGVQEAVDPPPPAPPPPEPQSRLAPLAPPDERSGAECPAAAVPREENWLAVFGPGRFERLPSVADQPFENLETGSIAAELPRQQPEEEDPGTADAFAGPAAKDWQQRLLLSLVLSGVWQGPALADPSDRQRSSEPAPSCSPVAPP